MLEYRGGSGDPSGTEEAVLFVAQGARVRVKRQDDGSDVVFDDLRDCGIVRVVGCNRHHCIKETVQGLRQRLPAVSFQILEHACGTPWGEEPELLPQEAS